MSGGIGVSTSLRFNGDFTSGGGVSGTGMVYHTGYDLLGSGFGNNVLAEEVCRDSIGHRLASHGTLAAMSELAVEVHGTPSVTGLTEWAGTLLFV